MTIAQYQDPIPSMALIIVNNTNEICAVHSIDNLTFHNFIRHSSTATNAHGEGTLADPSVTADCPRCIPNVSA